LRKAKQVYCKLSHAVAKALACRGSEFANTLVREGKKGERKEKNENGGELATEE